MDSQFQEPFSPSNYFKGIKNNQSLLLSCYNCVCKNDEQ